MKNLILILLLVFPLCAIAQREMTNVEKESMKTNAAFILQVNWTIAAKASYYTQNAIFQDLINADGIEKYGKTRNFLNAVKYEGYVDHEAPYLFLFLSKGMETVPEGQYSEQAVIDYMIAHGKFDELTDQYIAIKVSRSVF